MIQRRLTLLAMALCYHATSIAAFYAPNVPTASTTTTTKLALFGGGGAKIPKSAADRDQQAIAGVKAALSKPKTRSFPLIECDFPPLQALNKLGDGSLRSSNEVDQANLVFCKKLIQSISLPLVGPKTWLLTSASSSKPFNDKAASTLKGVAAVASLRSGLDDIGKNDICVLVAPNGNDYNAAQSLASSGIKTVVVNGLAKSQNSIPGTATMAYYLKPLTFSSQLAGYLIRSYPQPWTVVDAVSNQVLGSFSDAEILFGVTNTPDLRASSGLVQKAMNDRALAARQK